MFGSIISVVDKSTVEIIEPLNFKKHVFITLNIKKKRPIWPFLDVSFSSSTKVDKDSK